LVEDSSAVVREVSQSGQIPPELRQHARCVVVVPSLVSGGLILGARHGKGVATCRVASGWSTPAFVTITGGSAGLQAGFESADVVMLVQGERGMSQLFRSSFELGADTSAAFGPVGGTAQASTDTTMKTEIVAFAHSRGLFAGLQLSGASMRQDRPAAEALYGAGADVHSILSGTVQAPGETAGFVEAMAKVFPKRAPEVTPDHQEP
jgi:lipid-binding SYLF domain-containing protein